MNFIINRKVLISMLFIATTMLGYISYKQLKMEMIPNAELPMLFVQVNSSIEYTPEYIEQKVIIPIEAVVAGLENIEEISSTAGRRQGTVFISYEQNADLKFAYLKLDEQISGLSSELPDEFSVQVIKVDLESMNKNLMELQVRGSGGANRVRNFVDQKIAPELENIDGVAALNIYGGKQKSVDIILDKAACDAYKISPSRVRSILSRNMNLRQYGGMIKEEGKRFFVYLNAEYQDISQIENILVGRGQNPVQLKDIAKIYYGEKEEETISRINGKDAVTLMVINDAQANIIDLSYAIRKEIKALNKEFEDYDIEIDIQVDTAEEMEDNINQIIDLALIGGLLAIFILWIFLRNISLVMVLALAMPISIYTAFNFFFGFGISINGLTLVGIALAIGMLLDTSVVVLENIYRLRTMGLSPAEAVIQGTKEVSRSVVAATLTTIAVFFPFVFSSNFLLQLMGKHIGVSIVSTLLVSLVVSLLLIPMIVHGIITHRKKAAKEVYQKVSIDNRGVRIYLFLLKAALRNPAPTIIIAILLFVITISASMAVSVNKLNELETREINVYVTMPTGSTLETTDKIVLKIEEALTDIKEIEDVISKIEEEEAKVSLILKKKYQKKYKRSFGEVQAEVKKRVRDMEPAEISFSAPSGNRTGRGSGRGNTGGAQGFQKMMGIGEDEEYIVLKGQDFNLMVEVAEAIQSYVDELENVRRTSLSVRENQPEVHIDFNTRLMSDFDIPQNQVLSELSSFRSEVGSGTTFRLGTEEYEIMIKYDDTYDENAREDKTMSDLESLSIPNANDDNLYDLQSFSNIYYSQGMREISRVNQEKQIELTYQYEDDVYDSKDLLEIARKEIEDVIKNAGIPPGVAVELVQEESVLDDYKGLLLIALLLVYMILAMVFESFITPFVLLFSIPFAAIGSFFFLSITGNQLFQANSITGFLILLGVVVNNGIILIDFVNILRKKGYRIHRAIMLAGISRIRPILITTVTTCVAMLPLALGDTEYVKAIGPPFAVTVIGGLSVSTLLTLVYIPMLYNGIEHSLNWIKRLSLFLRLTMLASEIIGLALVFVYVDSLLWRIVGTLLLVIGIPVLVWFITSSLRKATTRIIPEEDDLHIKIDNLVKIYGRDSRMVRDFKASTKRNKELPPEQRSLRPNLEALIWQLPLLGFLTYFWIFYLESGLWQFVSSISVYYFTISILKNFLRLRDSRWLKRAMKFVCYLVPIFILILHFQHWENIALIIIIFFFWYLILAMNYVVRLIRREDFEIHKIRKAYRWFVRFVRILPGIGKTKERFKALKGVSLEIGTGMFGLLGPNGAGKSTMIRIICGILEQSYGKIWINGIDTELKREELQGLIGYLPQEFGMYENMTAYSYLEYQAMLKGLSDVEIRSKRIKEVLDSVHMWENKDKKIGSFSGGMKQRMGIAQVLLHLPRILVVDEPTAGLDPRERIRFRNMLVELSRERIVIFSTHIIEDISSSCNVMAVINQGEVVFKGAPKDMTNLARGKVWKLTLPAVDFEEATKNLLVVHHMRDHEQIKIRCIAAEKPHSQAVEENPLLEDAYLWLLKANSFNKI